ncbi:MAG TPA: phosphoadenylyl-sulfate reductase [Xanthobacteraceae bacterium]|jgi:sulfate adenylyltransferase large subunit/thioredoxin-dependent adenylylsulfate APS reductase|nr:phosphoadenylyl-sulfate reductase [Xanthobacteraceae bacterium]
MNAHVVPEVAFEPKQQGASSRPLVRIVIVGHVDHGKSTLIGRLLSETGSLPDGKLELLRAVSARRGMAFEWSFLLDALQTERDQGITIDTSQIRFRTPARDFVLIDAPGHTEFLRNMITGASQADAALLLVDAAEGVREQTLRHAYLLHFLGIRQVVVIVNKMDRVGYDDGRFREIDADITAHLNSFDLKPAAVIPISARHGDGVVERTAAIDWYRGPTVIEALDRFAPARPATALPLRLPVQAVYKFDDRRIVAGRIQSGRIAVGDEIAVAPSGKRAVVRSIEAWPGNGDAAPREAGAGQSVGITLDRELFIARGDVIARAEHPAPSGRRLRARIFWLHDSPLATRAYVTVRIGTAETRGTITAIANTLDPGDQSVANRDTVAQNHVGEVEIALSNSIAADLYEANPRTGRIVLDFGGHIAGGGLVLAFDSESKAVSASVEKSQALIVRATDLDRALAGLNLSQRLARIRGELDGPIVFTTSFGLEDQVILHHICEAGLDIDVVTLDTGRLFPETYATWEETERRYGRRIRAIYPRHAALEELIAAQGINGFYHAKEARIACCDVRKVEPLKRALAGAQGWITGLRADQSAGRSKVGLVTADVERNLLKFNPLIDWSRQAAQDFVAAHEVPINVLHQKGFLSIGCAPCTRAVRPGEPERAGRWWWEDDSKKECGLHVAAGTSR